MANEEAFFSGSVVPRAKKEYAKAADELKTAYDASAKPSYIINNTNDAAITNQSEFLRLYERISASHILRGFTSKEECKDDLRAIALKPAVWFVQGGYHDLLAALKLVECGVHLLCALVEFLSQKPEEPKSGMLNKFTSPFTQEETPKLQYPEQELQQAKEALIEVVVNVVKGFTYAFFWAFELGAQLISFALKCVFSLDSENQLEAKFNTWFKAGEKALEHAQVEVHSHTV